MSKLNLFYALVLAVSIFFNIVLFLGCRISCSNSPALNQYPFLAKRILNENFNDILVNFLDLRTDLRSTVEPFGQTFSFYFEYLPTGTSVGVNEKEEFYAASLFKLPVIMSYFRQQERLKERSDPVLTIQEEDIDKEFGDLWKKGTGYKLKMSEAIKLAISDSDNTAIRLVVPQITENDFEHVYQALDIDLRRDNDGARLTTKGYASILKALYFSSVLEKEDSQEILDLLTKTKFIDKLPAGVPENIAVAHKIGVYNKNGENEAYMDCGIVYVPNRPYALCMLSISDEDTARERMRLISQKIYNYVSTKK